MATPAQNAADTAKTAAQARTAAEQAAAALAAAPGDAELTRVAKDAADFAAEAQRVADDAAVLAQPSPASSGTAAAGTFVASQDFKSWYQHYYLTFAKGDVIDPLVATYLRDRGAPITIRTGK